MNTSDAMATTVTQSRASAPSKISVGRQMYWSIRRELWESPSIYMAPLAVAAVTLVAYAFGAALLPGHMPTRAMQRSHHGSVLGEVYDLAAAIIMVTVVLLQLLYCLDALYGERRDRSILFWKSLPVSKFRPCSPR